MENLLHWFFADLSWLQIAVLAVGAMIIGINKTAVPALGVLAVVLFTQFFDPHTASAAVLPLLCAGDLLAVAWYRRSANWKFVLALLPWALVGLVLGMAVVRCIRNTNVLGLVIALLILGVQALSLMKGAVQERIDKMRGGMAMAAIFGILAGFTTQVANAAGPVMAIYLVLMKFSKEEYIGSAAWYFLILNWIKLPLFALDGRLNWQVIKFVPGVFIFLILGSVIGILFLRNISQKSFTRIVQILTAVCAIRLLWMSLAKMGIF